MATKEKNIPAEGTVIRFDSTKPSVVGPEWASEEVVEDEVKEERLKENK